MSTLTVAEKECPRCEQTKPLDRFGICRANRDGHQSWCLACQRADKRDRRATDRAFAARDTKQRNAYRAAETRLRRAHRDEFDRYYAEELAMRGLT